MRTPLRLGGDEVPTVDVFITCCGESLDMILDTIRAACALDYPKERYRVILLDDGNSADLKRQVDSLKKAQRNLYYTARGIKHVTHSKAANLNHGLSFVEKLKTGPSEYVAVLDVDMIPMPSVLRAILPHLLGDPTMAMATLPQYFYNIPDSDPLCQGIDSIFDIDTLRIDTVDRAFCTGTGFVLQRSAAEKIGGIPIDQMSEDIMTTLVLNAQGLKVAYVWEPLQWGLVPDSFAGHAKQAARWELGVTSIVPLLWGPRLANLPLSERLQVAIGLLSFVSSAVVLTSAMFLIPAILISGEPLIALETPQQLRNLMMLSALQLLVAWLDGFIGADAIGFRTTIWPSYRYPYLAPFQSVALLGLLFPSARRFTPTGSMDDGEREREARASRSFIRRLRFLLGDIRIWSQLLVIVFIVYGATVSVRRALGMNISFQHQLQRLFVSVAWPPAFVHWTMFIVECWKPISYAVFLPKIHSRETLLHRDPETKVAYPSNMAKDGERIRPSQKFALAILAYGLCVLAYSCGRRFE